MKTKPSNIAATQCSKKKKKKDSHGPSLSHYTVLFCSSRELVLESREVVARGWEVGDVRRG